MICIFCLFWCSGVVARLFSFIGKCLAGRTRGVRVQGCAHSYASTKVRFLCQLTSLMIPGLVILFAVFAATCLSPSHQSLSQDYVISLSRARAKFRNGKTLFRHPLSSLADHSGEANINGQHEKATTGHRIFFKTSSVEDSGVSPVGFRTTAVDL